MNYRKFCSRALIGALGVAFLGAIILLADEQSSDIYIKKAQEFAKQKNYASAQESFDKAVKEAPDLPEAYYERGMFFWKCKEMAEAIKDLNKAADLINAMAKPTLNQKNLLPKIASCQAEYKKLADEFDTLNQKYLIRYLDLVEQGQSKPEPLLIYILDSVYSVIPNSLKERYSALRTGLFSETVKQMTPLFNGTGFEGWEGENPNWTVENGAIIGQSAGRMSVCKHTVQINSSAYAISAKFQVLEANSPQSVAGLVFGNRFDQFMIISVTSDRIQFVKFTLQTQDGQSNRRALAPETLASRPLPAGFDWKNSNEIMLMVQGSYLNCYLNNTLALAFEFPPEYKGLQKIFYGAPGLQVQECKAQFSDFKYMIYE